MAATATQQILNNGSRNLVLHYTIGGTTGDASAAVLVDVSALDANIGVNGLKLTRASWSLSGFDLKLAWDATANVDFIEMRDGEFEQCFEDVGGITNNAGAGATGDVVFTTNGYTAAPDVGHFTLWFKKKNQNK